MSLSVVPLYVALLCLFSENVHAEVVCRYVRDILDVDPNRQILISDTIRGSRALRRMKEWNSRWISDCDAGRIDLGEGLLALAVSRGIFRCSMRAILAYPDLTGALEALDSIMSAIGCQIESYVRFACLLYGRIDVRPTWTRVIGIIDEAVAIEKDVVRGMIYSLLSHVLGS